MRFFVTGDQRRHSIINAIILMFLGYIALFWISNGLMYFHKMGLDAASVVEYYLGSEEKFTQPKSYQSLLEVSHFHLFSMGILIVTLTHLLLFTSLAVPLKIGLTASTFVAAVTDELAGWLVRFVHPVFAYLKIGSFLILELSLASLLILTALSLLSNRAAWRHSHSKAAGSGSSHHRRSGF
jgi:hypothetical protein